MALTYDIKDAFKGLYGGCGVKYQLIQHRLLEPVGSVPDFTRRTLEGDIAPSEITFYRLQCDSEGNLRSYVAEGEVLPVATRSFGGIGVFAIPEMGRFYRHVLIQKRYGIFCEAVGNEAPCILILFLSSNLQKEVCYMAEAGHINELP